MNTLDLVLCVFVLIYALSGYQQGFIVGAASTLGLLLGGFVGVKITPAILDNFDPAISVSIAALLVVLACAFTGQGLGAFTGTLIRRRVTWRPARTVDALGGGALSVAAMLLIAWVLGVAASGAQVGALNEEIRGSRVLGAVDSALPGGADRVLATFNSLVDSSRFPRYLEPFTPEHIISVPTPSAGILHRAGVRAAEVSVTKIIGVCQLLQPDARGEWLRLRRGPGHDQRACGRRGQPSGGEHRRRRVPGHGRLLQPRGRHRGPARPGGHRPGAALRPGRPRRAIPQPCSASQRTARTTRSRRGSATSRP